MILPGKNKGSVLILSIMLLFVMLALTLLMFTHEFISKNAAVRARMATNQAQAIEVTLQRFTNTFSAQRDQGKILPIPSLKESSNDPVYDLPFECSADNVPGFRVRGRWKKDDSIYYPPRQNPGRDFTDVPEAGYYNKIAAPGYDKTNVPPWHNLVVINTPLKSRYIASYSFHFPYAVFAPNGRIHLKDVYGCTNPLNDNNKSEDYFSGVPVNAYARNAITVDEYPYGKAYSEKGSIDVDEKNGVMKFTDPGKSRIDDAKKYVKIFQKQLDVLYDNMTERTLDKDSVISGRKVTTVIPFATEPLPDDFMTLEQAAEFPFSAMTVNYGAPGEKTMGGYYTFVVHPPNPPDVEEISTDAEKTREHAARAYEYLDKIQGIFERYGIDWRNTMTEICLVKGGIALVKDTIQTAKDLTEAISKSFLPFVGWYWRIKAVQYSIKLGKLIADDIAFIKFSISYAMLRVDEGKLLIHVLGKVKDEPKTVEEDKTYSNAGWSFVKACKIYAIPLIAEVLNQSGTDKFKNLGMAIAPLTHTGVRLTHFGKGDFDSNWKSIDEDDFTFNGTFIIPRGRTLKFPHDLTIEGDLWIQDGAALYVGGELNVNTPENPPDLPEMVRPSGRVFLGSCSSIVVEGDFKCKGSVPLGSIVLSSPHQKVNTITSVIYSKNGKITIPYGIMPGIAVDELAKITDSELPPEMSKNLKSLINGSANISKIAGPFHYRKAYFSENAATVLVFRHKALGFLLNPLYLPIVTPLKVTKANFMNGFFPIFTESFTHFLNAYLGEHTFAHTDWWIFGEGIVPILPKMDTGTLAEKMSVLTGMASTLEQLKNYEDSIENLLLSDTPLEVIDAAKLASKGTASVYGVFFNEKFSGESEKKAATLSSQILQTSRQVYQPFTQITDSMEKARDVFDSASRLLISFYSNAFPPIQAHLPGGDDQKTFIESPGVLIYSGKNIEMGTGEKILPHTVMPASGLFIGNEGIRIRGAFRVVGCLMSLNGHIDAYDTHLRYYPYFSQASIYLPKDVEGDLNRNLKLVTDDDLKSDTDPCNVGITIPGIFAEGWEFYSEYYDYKPFRN